MTHKELIAELAKRLDWTQTKVSDTLDVLVNEMNEILSQDDQIVIPNFGVFGTKKRDERISVNPQTQQRYLVPPTIVATFKPAVAIKDELKRNEGDE